MGNCNSIVPSSGSLSISERVRHLQKTPFFMYLDESQLKDMAMCFSTSKTYSQSSTVSLMPNSISVVASGELSMSTLLPSNTSKAGQSRGYLCKKVSGDIVNKMATTADAKRKVRYVCICIIGDVHLPNSPPSSYPNPNPNHPTGLIRKTHLLC